MALKGSVWSWGSNAHGAIGVLDQDENEEVLAEQFQVARTPKFLRHLSNTIIVQVACGNQFSAVLTSTREVWTWGNGQHGKLGHLDQNNQPLPKKIESLDTLSITKIACGQEHMMCIANGGSVYSWGCGFFGRLGHAVVKSEYQPKEINALATNPIVDIWCGATSFAKDSRGHLWAWGSAGYGQIGRGDRPNEMLIPVEVSLTDVKYLACSERHVMAIAAGHLYAWGSNSEGQLGLGNFKDATKPTRVIFPILPGVTEKDFEPLHVSCGRTYTVVVTPSGVYSFGGADEGELGTGTQSARTPTPTKVKFPPDAPPIVKVSCGDTFVAALTSTNVIYTWGSDKAGQLATGDLLSNEPTEQRASDNTSGTRRTVKESDFSGIMDLTPKKAKKTRNPAAPTKKKEASQGRQAATTATAMTNLLEPRQIKWFYGVQDLACGHSHSMAILDYSHRMHQVARDGDIMGAKAVLAEIKNYGDAKRRDPHAPQQYSVIHWACLRNHAKLTSYLLDLFADMVNHVSHKESRTALHYASIHGNPEIVKRLLESKADVHAQDSVGNTPLHYAGNLKRLDICSTLILAGASADTENHKSKKPLEYFSLQEVFELKKSIKVFDVAIYFAPEDHEFAKELKAQVETFHIVCSLNEEKLDAKAFIKASRAMIFILSNSSATSHDSLHYIRLAKDAKKHVYPIWLHKATMGPALESLIYRNQLVDFTDRSKLIDSTAQLVAGLRNIFEEKKEGEQDSVMDDSAEVDDAFSKLVQHPNMIIAPDDLRQRKHKYVFLCHDILDAKIAALLAANLCDHGFIVCYYNEDPRVIGELITDCWAFLLVLSSRSAGSSVIRDQIALAENRQKLILPVLVQRSAITLDPAMTYTLARTARFPFFVGDKDVHACVERLVDAVRLAKKVSEKSERLKNLREEVVVTNDKLNKSNKYIADIKSKVKTKKTVAIDQPVNWR